MKQVIAIATEAASLERQGKHMAAAQHWDAALVQLQHVTSEIHNGKRYNLDKQHHWMKAREQYCRRRMGHKVQPLALPSAYEDK